MAEILKSTAILFVLLNAVKDLKTDASFVGMKTKKSKIPLLSCSGFNVLYF